MRVIRRHTKTKLLVAILCIGVGASLLVAGSISIQAKSMPSPYENALSEHKFVGPDERNSSSTNTPTPVPTPSVTPQPKPTVTNTAPANAAPSPKKTAAATTVPVSVPAATVQATPPPQQGDTSAQVRQVVTAQAVKTNFPSNYPSDKISTNQRDNMYKASLLIAAAGVLLYLLSYASSWQWMYKNNDVAPSKTVTE